MTMEETVSFMKGNLSVIRNMSSIGFEDDILTLILKSFEVGDPIEERKEDVKKVIYSMTYWLFDSAMTKPMSKEDRTFLENITLFMYNSSLLYGMEKEANILSSTNKLISMSYSLIDAVNVLRIIAGKMEASVSFSNVEKDAASNFIDLLR